MNTIVVKLPVDESSGGYIEVEIDPEAAEGIQWTSGRDGDAEPRYSLSSSLDHVLPALQTLIGKLRGKNLRPDEIRVELGLKIGGQTGMVFTKGTAEANFKVSLLWSSTPGALQEEDEVEAPDTERPHDGE